MKKLKVYKNPDFRLVEVLSGSVADQLFQDSFTGNKRPDEGVGQTPGTTTPNPDDDIWADAGGARQGIWDE